MRVKCKICKKKNIGFFTSLLYPYCKECQDTMEVYSYQYEDETCICGHNKINHVDLSASLHSNKKILSHCAIYECKCTKFVPKQEEK